VSNYSIDGQLAVRRGPRVRLAGGGDASLSALLATRCPDLDLDFDLE